ncbi:hypothetical protein ACA910_015570 [Epithemia clementina (nom. ined.)]
MTRRKRLPLLAQSYLLLTAAIFLLLLLCHEVRATEDGISGTGLALEESETPDHRVRYSGDTPSILEEDDGTTRTDSPREATAEESIEEEKTSKNESTASSTGPSSVNKRLWGAAPSGSETIQPSDPSLQNLPTGDSSSTTTTTKTNNGKEKSQSTSSPTPASHLPFVTKAKTQHPPPEGFVISARIYIDSKDKLAHVEMDPMTLPYWDCGVSGSTTSPIAVKDATFRHSLTPTTSWTTGAGEAAADGTHPLVGVALSPLTIETNSGETKALQAGEAFLLEDGLLPGHKLVPTPHHELQVLYLTLRQTHYHPGKERFHLHAAATKSLTLDPCPVSDSSSNSSSAQSRARRNLLIAGIIRRGLFGLIGLSFSTLVADFFSKTAPLWLAVGVGGTCFVVGGTALSIFAGERALASIELWLEQRLLLAVQQTIPPNMYHNASTAAVSKDSLEQETA